MITASVMKELNILVSEIQSKFPVDFNCLRNAFQEDFRFMEIYFN